MAGKAAIFLGRGIVALGAVALLGLSLSACRAGAEGDARIRPTRTLEPATATPVVTPAPVVPTPTDLPGPASFFPAQTPVTLPGLPDDLSAAIQRAAEDLVASGDAASIDLRVLSLQRFLWEDSSLGCAALESTGASAQGRAEGYRILLAGPDEVFAYHSAGDTLVRCPVESLAVGLTGEPLAPDPFAASMAELVRRDWATETGASASEVDLMSLLAVVWPDTSLGCPQPAGTYAGEQTPGFRIVVRAGEREAIYHTNIRSFARCAPEAESLPDLLREALATPVAAAAE